MAISAEAVRDLRERTGAGMMDCKRALEECDGDVEKAVLALREAGLAAAAKKAGRDAREGLVSSYIHTGGRVGVLLEVNCETDFVARNEQFQKLVKDIAMQIAGLHPLYVSQDQIPAAALEAKRAALLEDEALAKKPEAIRAHGEETVGQLITNAIATIGENIRVRRFVRYALGEEL
jgi:elongation factor Ts